ncbi:MAG: rhodanese-like domain-containing protein [Desulfobacteraceae bacterium]
MIKLKELFTAVEGMEPEQVKDFMASRPEGSYTLLDVRQPAEYEEAHLPGAKFIPLAKLYDSLEELDRGKPIITYCAIGGRSRVAAQMLSGMGFGEVYNLKGGIKAWQGQKATGPQELNLDLVRGDESPTEIIELAFGLEVGLQKFYTVMQDKAQDQELAALFRQLGKVEEQHKKKLFDLRNQLESQEKDLAGFEAALEPKIMEGGFDMEEFIKKNEPYMQSVSEALETAMILETQALDLYLRFPDKTDNPQTKEVLFQLAQEEKGHLASLGRLFDEKSKP